MWVCVCLSWDSVCVCVSELGLCVCVHVCVYFHMISEQDS